jgi:CBS domain containing-hemolysin-like protein
MKNICKPRLRHSKRGREDGKGRGGRRSKKPYALPLPSLPVLQLAGHQHVYVSQSTKLRDILQQVHQCSGETYHLHLQPWRWRQYVSRKHWYLPMSLHGVTTQNIIIFTTARTSNLTFGLSCMISVSIWHRTFFLWNYNLCIIKADLNYSLQKLCSSLHTTTDSILPFAETLTDTIACIASLLFSRTICCIINYMSYLEWDITWSWNHIYGFKKTILKSWSQTRSDFHYVHLFP